LAQEYYLLARMLRTSYSDFLIMPTYFRKFLVKKIYEENTVTEN